MCISAGLPIDYNCCITINKPILIGIIGCAEDFFRAACVAICYACDVPSHSSLQFISINSLAKAKSTRTPRFYVSVQKGQELIEKELERKFSKNFLNPDLNELKKYFGLMEHEYEKRNRDERSHVYSHLKSICKIEAPTLMDYLSNDISIPKLITRQLL